MKKLYDLKPFINVDSPTSSNGQYLSSPNKVVEGKNEKTKVFDTTINLDRKLKPGEEKEIMKQIELRMKGVDSKMKNMEVELSKMDLPDSGMIDSIQNMTRKTIILQGCHGGGESMRNYCPQGFNFNYNFDMPDG